MADVFISYKSERRNAARHLQKVLKLNGFEAWYDYGLIPGDDFEPRLMGELRAAKACVVLWCAMSVKSPWVIKEAAEARSRGAFLPTWIEKASLPKEFAGADTIDLTSWDGDPTSAVLFRLFADVGRRVGREPSPNFSGLRELHDDWVGFGKPSLASFTLGAPVAAHERAVAGHVQTPPSPAPGLSDQPTANGEVVVPSSQREGSQPTPISVRVDWRHPIPAPRQLNVIMEHSSARVTVEVENPERFLPGEALNFHRTGTKRDAIRGVVYHTGALTPREGVGPMPRPTLPRKAMPEMVRVSPGRFSMGSREDELGHDYTERPQHEVLIAYAFALGKYPVAIAQWDAVRRIGSFSSSSEKEGERDRLPAIVSFHEAQDYVALLNELSGLNERTDRYRLPSEAEWEYACRAGTTTRFFWGDDETRLGDHAWYETNAGGQIHPVGERHPNPFGLFDMLGNASEWCEDQWHENYYGAPQDGSAWVSGGDSSQRVLRGGSDRDCPRILRSAARDKGCSPNQEKASFRVARSL